MNRVKAFVIAALAILSLAVSVFVQTPYHQNSQATEVAQSLPVLVINSQKMPTIAAHIRQAQAQGYPSTLTRLTDKKRINSNRQAACGNFVRPAGFQCDEYPFAGERKKAWGGGVS